MKFFALLLLPVIAWGQMKTETFIIQVSDQNIHVLSPEKPRKMYAVIVENRSLSDQVGKFIAGNTILKFVSVKSGETQTVEMENKTNSPVVFVPVSPAFQEVPLLFGKKAYEIPPKE